MSSRTDDEKAELKMRKAVSKRHERGKECFYMSGLAAFARPFSVTASIAPRQFGPTSYGCASGPAIVMAEWRVITDMAGLNRG
jgi:hypothetical protein